MGSAAQTVFRRVDDLRIITANPGKPLIERLSIHLLAPIAGRMGHANRRREMMGWGPYSKTHQRPLFLRQDNSLELRIKVVPGASKSEIVGILGNRLKVRIAAAPEQGKANQALLALLRKWLGTSQIELIAGSASAEKTVRVNGLNKLTQEQIDAVMLAFDQALFACNS